MRGLGSDDPRLLESSLPKNPLYRTWAVPKVNFGTAPYTYNLIAAPVASPSCRCTAPRPGLQPSNTNIRGQQSNYPVVTINRPDFRRYGRGAFVSQWLRSALPRRWLRRVAAVPPPASCAFSPRSLTAQSQKLKRGNKYERTAGRWSLWLYPATLPRPPETRTIGMDLFFFELQNELYKNFFRFCKTTCDQERVAGDGGKRNGYGAVGCGRLPGGGSGAFFNSVAPSLRRPSLAPAPPPKNTLFYKLASLSNLALYFYKDLIRQKTFYLRPPSS